MIIFNFFWTKSATLKKLRIKKKRKLWQKQQQHTTQLKKATEGMQKTDHKDNNYIKKASFKSKKDTHNSLGEWE